MKYRKTMYLLALCITIVNVHAILEIASYKAVPLMNLVDNIRVMRKDTISFGYRIFNEVDCKRILGRALVMEKGYQPIQINVINNTDRHLLLSSDNFSFSCVSYFKVAEAVQFSFFKRAAAWVILSLFADWAISTMLPSMLKNLVNQEAVHWQQQDKKFLIDYNNISHKLSYVFLVPAIVQAVTCPRANERLLADYAEKALINKIITPYSSANGIIFVAHHCFDPMFSFKLIDQVSGEQYIFSTTNQQLTVHH